MTELLPISFARKISLRELILLFTAHRSDYNDNNSLVRALSQLQFLGLGLLDVSNAGSLYPDKQVFQM